ncbi:hypothetical protein SAMN04489716_0622 [Actinoplanes derwentensis]|uniref:Secreted protein n=2 Tax=Actinoplanes derwentensis TaxID=113562 RepID=A0A1H1RNC6_9ACTN|nr:hypothetical protein SAMN04489716_0622 [Actinoplanes derwentensis]
MRRSFLFVILMIVTAVLFPADHHHHTDGHFTVATCVDSDAVPVHEHRRDPGTMSPVASRGRLAEPGTTSAGASVPAPPLPVCSLIAHVDLRLPGVLRV